MVSTNLAFLAAGCYTIGNSISESRSSGTSRPITAAQHNSHQSRFPGGKIPQNRKEPVPWIGPSATTARASLHGI